MMFRVAGQCPVGKKECAARRVVECPDFLPRPTLRNEKSKFHLSVSESDERGQEKGRVNPPSTTKSLA